ncbi:MAG TPA: DUF1269 domain-containing protein [Acidimicrobiia bacterium]|jgi:uncharacterized membrane protein|nr:DUF1269 domain-containing protein [Acidimicrobiia bacterium]
MASNYNFVLVVYDDLVGARAVFNILQGLQKEEKLDIKEAAVVTRGPSGKIAVDNLGFVGTGKGGVLGLVIGAVAASAPLAGLLVGGLIGFSRSGDRRRLKELLDDELGVNQSALAIVIKEADWVAVAEATKDWTGEIVRSELSDEALATLEGLSSENDVAAARGETLEAN